MKDDYTIPPAGQKYLSVYIDNSEPSYWDQNWDGIFGEEHIPHVEGKWSLPNVGKIKMYKKDQMITLSMNINQ